MKRICSNGPLGLVLVAALSSIVPLAAQTSFDWLSSPSFPAQLAMAAAGVAQNNSPEALSQNPAALGTVSGRRQYWLGGQIYPVGVSQIAATVVMPTQKYAWGFTMRGMQYGNFSGFDENGLPLDVYSASETEIRAGVRRTLGRFLAVGGSAGLVNGSLADVASVAAIWSAGFQLHLTAVDAYIGGSLQNDGTFLSEYATETTGDQLPTLWSIGLSKALAHLPLTFHLAATQSRLDGTVNMRVGGEFILPGALVLRWGIDQSKTDYQRGEANADLLSGLSFGVGTRAGDGLFAKFSLDSAIKLQGPLGVTTAFALTMRH